MNAILFIILTIIFTVSSQLLLKWRVTAIIEEHGLLESKVSIISKTLLDPLALLALFFAFVASLSWILALSKKIELSIAYPLTSMSFVLVFIFSIAVFNESFSIFKVIGLLIIITGVVFLSFSL
ncbi:hypothetical protein KKH43_02415 [Patescibacteria group bacterium]|nr:hypothetical protein [Patescibacteria group bacterium]